MADTVLNTTVFDGAKRLITHYNVVGDGTGNTTKIVDVSELTKSASTTANGKPCTRVKLVKVDFHVSANNTHAIRLAWDATTDVVFQTLNGEMSYDYSAFGGLQNTNAAGVTGDVNLIMPAHTSGDTATVVCTWLKQYD